MSLTTDQQSAVAAPGSVVVLAGAGAGKTHMLAQRFLHHVAVDGLSPLAIVCSTFTEAAASELRARVRAHAQAAGQAPAILAAIEAAPIGTLHQLCARIVREHPEEAGLARPDFAILDDRDGAIWLAEQRRTLQARILDEATGWPEGVYPETLEAAFALLEADPLQAEEARAVSPETQAAACREAGRLTWEALLTTPEFQRARALAAGAPMMEKLAGFQAMVAALGPEPEPERLAEIDRWDLRAVRASKAMTDAERDFLGCLKPCRDALRAVLPLLTWAPGEAEAWQARFLAFLLERWDALARALAEAKREANVLGFADLEVHALRALEHEAVRIYYRARWKAFLLDEFQDTNPVQARLLTHLSDGARLTIVGDPKQSIYGFRRADVGVFAAFGERLVEAGGRRVRLATSFRATGELVTRFNALFEPMLGALHEPMDAPRKHPEGERFLAVRAACGDPDDPLQPAEARYAEAAHWVRALRQVREAGFQVHDRESGAYRPLAWGDVAVLGRSWASLAPMEAALEAAGIPAVVTGGGHLLGTREGRDGLAMLRFLAHPHDSDALLAVLRSPAFSVSDAALRRAGEGRAARAFEERFDAPETSLWTALATTGEPELGAAVALLSDLLARRRRLDAGALLREIDRETGYSGIVANLPRGARRLADWRGLISLVEGLEGDVFWAARRLSAYEAAGIRLPRPALSAAGAVTLTTRHGSKGLEWPLVIVPDLARRSPVDAPVLRFDPALGLAARPPKELALPTPGIYELLKQQAQEADKAEAQRLLYVAFTRAMDAVWLSAAKPEATALTALNLGLASAGIGWEPFTRPAP